MIDKYQLSHDCINASSVNMFNNKIDNYLARAGYTKVEHFILFFRNYFN